MGKNVQNVSNMIKLKVLGSSALFLFNLSLALFITSKLVFLQECLQNERHAVEVAATSAKIASLTHRLGSDCVISASPGLRRKIGHVGNLEEIKGALSEELKKLATLSKGDEKARAILQEQSHLYGTVLAKYKQDIQFFANRDLMREQGVPYESLAFNSDIAARYAGLLEEYKKTQIEKPEVVKQILVKLKLSLIAGLTFNLLVGLVAIGLIFNRIAKRLENLSGNVQKFLEGKKLGPPDGERDEIGRLDALLRAMTGSIKAAEEQKILLLQSAPEVICAIDEHDNFTLLNHAVLTQWAIKEEDLLGKSWHQLAGEQAQEKIQSRLDDLRKRKRSIEAQAFEVEIECPNGSLETRWACYYSSLNNLVYCFISDVGRSRRLARELKDREERIRVLAESLPLGLLVLDENERIKSANMKFSELCGTEPTALYGKVAASYFDFGGLAKTESYLRTPGKKKARLRGLKRLKTASLWCEIVIVPLGEDSEERLVLVSDISEKLRLENLRQDFISLLRRNLREPLEKMLSIIGSLNLPEEKQKAKITRITQNTGRVLRLIEDLLSLQTMGQGRVVEKIMPVDCRELVQEAIISMEDFALNQEVKLELLADQLEQYLTNGDRVRLVQVLVNLISNAIKFSGRGKVVQLQLSIRPGTTFIEIAVIDKGRGVPAENRQEIFKPYIQSQSNDKRMGTGLGLAICRAIAEAHGGEIGLRSNSDDIGSCFYITLPRLTGSEVSHAQ